MSEEYGTVKVPKELIKKIEAQVNGTDFKSVDEYVTFVLEEVVKEDDDETTEVYSEEDERKVKERLRALGYID